MRNTFKVLFYIKKNAPLRNGWAPIMGRITINGQRTQFSTRLSVTPASWDTAQGRVCGRSNMAVQINEKLANIRFHIERCYNKLFYEQAFVTPVMVKEMYFGGNHKQETVVAFFKQHNDEFKRMVGVSRSMTTYYKYYGQTNEKYKEDSRKSNTADRKPITYSRASNFGSKNEM